MKPVQRLNKESLRILEQYDSDADKAIFLMEIKLKDHERQSSALQYVTKPAQKPKFGDYLNDAPTDMPDSFWKKLEQTVDSCIERAKRY
jgi:hypothetical protein